MEALCVSASPGSGLTVGRLYVVYAAYCALDGGQWLLVSDGMPIWAELGSFEIVDGRMPSSWRFTAFQESERLAMGLEVKFAIGDLALVGTAGALRSLLEYDKSALAEFESIRERQEHQPRID